MRRVLLFALTATAAGGCAVVNGPSWYRPGSAEAQFEAEASQCESVALARFPPMTMGMPGYFSAQNEWCTPTSGGTNCSIIGSGYNPQVQSEADTNAAPRENAFRSCMATRGWRPDYTVAGEPIAPPGGLPEAAVRQALTNCRSMLQSRSERNLAKFDQCVMNRARELSGAHPPA